MIHFNITHLVWGFLMLSHNFDLHHYVFVFSCQGKQPLLSAAGQQFSTYDRDNDKDPESNCAGLLQGGWWFNRCTGGNPPSDTPVESNLNGEYSHPVDYSSQDYRGIRWNTWDGLQIAYSRMQIVRCGKGVYNRNGFYCWMVEWTNEYRSIMWDSWDYVRFNSLIIHSSV